MYSRARPNSARVKWDELSDSVFIGASDYEEKLEEDQDEMKPLDSDFHLDVGQESDGNRIVEMTQPQPEDECHEQEENE
jgi:hypothetical protein